MEIRKVAFAADHAGYELKEVLKEFVSTKGITVVDFGTNSTESTDYSDYAHPMADAVEKGTVDMGISVCYSGNGINMTANKHQGIRAALCWNEEISRLARAHNDANICSLPAHYVSIEEAKKIINIFFDTTFDGGRHKRRIDKIPC